jgi:steroid delta-isomerase-like uncharacterized protein
MRRVHLVILIGILALMFGLSLTVFQPLFAAPSADGNPASNKQTIQALINEAYNRGNTAIITQVYVPEYEGQLSASNPSVYRTRADYISLIEQYRQAFSNFNATVDLLVAEEDWVSSRITLHGVFDRGTYYGISPSGNTIEIPIHTFHHFNTEGQIIEEVIEWDNLAFSVQLGLIDAELLESAG